MSYYIEHSRFKNMSLLQSGRHLFDIMEKVSKIQPVPFHYAHLGIDKQKAKNLIEMCEKCIRPWAYHSFYKTLPIRREGTHTEETKEDSNFD